MPSSAVSTVEGHVNRAIDFYNTPSKYFSIGKTTEWSPRDIDIPNVNDLTSDDNPPEPSPDGDLTDVLGYKIVESLFLVYPDPSGEIKYNNLTWKIAKSIEDAKEHKARWVYMSSWLKWDDLVVDISYRQVGVVTGLVRKEGVSTTKSSVMNSEVEDRGTLQVIFNRTPVYRLSTQREQLVAVVEF